MRFNYKQPIGLLAGLLALGMLVVAPSASGYVRPQGASPIATSLALAYKECGPGQETPNWVHGGTTVPGVACNGDPAAPPGVNANFGRLSTLLTAGEPPTTAAKFKGNIKLIVCNAASPPGGCPANGGAAGATQDVLTPKTAPLANGTATDVGKNYLQDVRCGVGLTNASMCASANAAGGADFGTTMAGFTNTALLKATSNIRITDLGTGDTTAASPCGSGTGPRANCPYLGTTHDVDFDVPILCTPTADTSIGGFCTPLYTSINSAQAGAVGPAADLLRGNVEIKQIKVQDGGPDGNAFIPDAPGNTDYAVQGIFLP